MKATTNTTLVLERTQQPHTTNTFYCSTVLIENNLIHTIWGSVRDDNVSVVTEKVDDAFSCLSRSDVSLENLDALDWGHLLQVNGNHTLLFTLFVATTVLEIVREEGSRW